MSGKITDNKSRPSGLIKSAAVSGGKVLQSVMGTSTTASAGTETDWTDTGLNVTITPSATTSKIFVQATTTSKQPTGDAYLYFTIERQVSGGSDTNLGDSTFGLNFTEGDTNYNVSIYPMYCHILDSPSTTSAITYEFQRKHETGVSSAGAMYQDQKGVIIATEVGA
jgi:hypothetical protein|tara:strand:- start:807 stop:1307 length:501 start_codon:yes stop_codon:yes gene_type:complete